jgi:N-carbamoyl-L-amino-acid hydrolase
MAVDSPTAARTLERLRTLQQLTQDERGAQRVCWSETWSTARTWLERELTAIGVACERDEACNLWATLPGERSGTIVVGSHIDSVRDGGWLDGALGVAAALGVLADAASRPSAERHTLALVDWADEEGVSFGRSCFGSSAVAGSLDVAELRSRRDRDARSAEEVLGAHGVDFATIARAQERLADAIAYVELHIEQGPVLEQDRQPVAAVSGTDGVRRLSIAIDGASGHSGTTPMERRRDAAAAAAALAVAVEDIAQLLGGRGTVGALTLSPGLPTVIANRAELVVDLRHGELGRLDAMAQRVRAAADACARERGCGCTIATLSSADPQPFDPTLVALAQAVATAHGGRPAPLASGALHDATEVARRVPTAMLFTSSIDGVSHAAEEDTPIADLHTAIACYAELVERIDRELE